MEEIKKRIDELRVELAESIAEYENDWVQIEKHLTNFDYIELVDDEKEVCF